MERWWGIHLRKNQSSTDGDLVSHRKMGDDVGETQLGTAEGNAIVNVQAESTNSFQG